MSFYIIASTHAFYEFVAVRRYLYICQIYCNTFFTDGGNSTLHCAAQKGNIDVVNALVKAGSKVNEKDEVIS